jgi:arginine decarboxylase-like protein
MHSDIPKELSPEQLNKALTEAYRLFHFVVMEAAVIDDEKVRARIYQDIASCMTAITAQTVFTLYRDHTQALDEVHKQARIAVTSLKKKRIADKVFHDTVKGTIQ